ncbi:hypothetical protein [Tuwongella immobilis]|uniref:Uncharacterized protein n=1 Tax=Tuwongella immobilis TaxID=692036 RepID=A0A6C2YUH6_9BACT|nr:hypothetical protein [Tuwongella immobilis]VIP05007.1 unnamed protein product [Tuwongella immobilis]VTS07372.1 unnamed protein product [Tuwongella immobilis]
MLRSLWWHRMFGAGLLGLAMLGVATQLVSADGSDIEELRRNKALFDRLSASRQQQIRKLDADLHELPQPELDSLNTLLDRYAVWLSRLDEADRQRVMSQTGNARLAVIQELREKQWEQGLPAAWRAELAKNPHQRAEKLAAYRRMQQQFNDDWAMVIRNWDDLRQNRMPLPILTEEFRRDLVAHLELLRPQLSANELARLTTAEQRLQAGDWIVGARMIVDLSDRHPLIPGPLTGPKQYSELPKDVQQFLDQKGLTAAREPNFPGVGRWPDYAVAVSELVARKNLRLPTELGPCRPNQFSPPINAWIDRLERVTLKGKTKDRERLQQAEGHWPDYPRVVLQLAKQHQIVFPGWTLPGPLEKWERFRTGKKKKKS